MDYSPILVSLKVTFFAAPITFVLGVFAAWGVMAIRRQKLKIALDALLTLPLVLPPTVAGFFLLYLFGVKRPLGEIFLNFFNYKIVFSPTAAILAAVVVSFPLMYRSALGAFEQVDLDVIGAARTLGMPERHIFWRILMPLSMPGVASGAILATARALGEFGATAMIAGNIAGKTRTLPLAVYSAVAGGRMEEAFSYVAILALISFLAVVGLNCFTRRLWRFGRPAGGGKP